MTPRHDFFFLRRGIIRGDTMFPSLPSIPTCSGGRPMSRVTRRVYALGLVRNVYSTIRHALLRPPRPTPSRCSPRPLITASFMLCAGFE
jgi:hypothetical protein